MSFDLSEAYLTGSLSFLSLVGSLLVLASYWIATRKSSPKTSSKLIRNLAISDAVWFLASLIEAAYWTIDAKSDGSTGDVPDLLCFICAPLQSYGRMTSLFWTCCISYDLYKCIERRALQAVTRNTRIHRVKLDKMDGISVSSSSSAMYRFCCDDKYYKFYLFVNIFSLPGPIITIISHQTSDDKNLGCSAGYESIGSWYMVSFVELLPITIGFILNIFMFVKIRLAMSSPSYPLSVKNRRRNVMYNYILVCIACWSPTLLGYVLALAIGNNAYVDICSRSCLYLTGLLNFLVYGMQDRYLKESFRHLLVTLGCSGLVKVSAQPLKQNYQEKTVMFEDSIQDQEKEKNSIFKYHRLSDDQKCALYATRPDLNLRADIMEQLLTDDIEVGASLDDHDSESKVVHGNNNQAGLGVSSDSDEDTFSDCQEGGGPGQIIRVYRDSISPMQQQQQTDGSQSSSEFSSDEGNEGEGKNCYVS